MEHFKNSFSIINDFIKLELCEDIDKIVQSVSMEMTKNRTMLFVFRAMVVTKSDFFDLGVTITEDLRI